MIERLHLRLQKWRQLSWDERWLFFNAILLLLGTALALRLFGFKRVYAGLQRPLPHTSAPKSKNERIQQAQSISALVQNGVSIIPFPITCLPRSLALKNLLHKQGIESDLKIGVQQVNAELFAHAWLEYEGVVINDSANVGQSFMAFDNLSILNNARII